MAVTTTPRFAVTRWSAGTDPFSRSQMDASHAQVEALAAIYGQGTLANRPAAGVVGRYYVVRGDTVANNGREFYDDGTAWWELGVNGHNTASRTGAAGSVGHTVHGAAGQTANLSEWRSSTNALLGRVHADGSITFGAATLAATAVTTLTASGATSLAGLTVSGSATFAAALTVNGTLKASTFKSTATRASGLAKTELNDDGTGRMDALIPPGHFMLSLRATVADGWLEMNGQTVSTTTYRDLWEALGSPGGAGATSFTIPDWRDRTAVGASATKPIGSFGGAADVTLTVNHLPGHTHTIAHDHTMAHTHTIAHTHDFAHTHTMNHDHGGFYSEIENADHAHYTYMGGGGHEHVYQRPGTGPQGSGNQSNASYSLTGGGVSTGGGGGHEHAAWSGGVNVNHKHWIDVPNYAGSTGGASTTTTGAASNASSGGASNATTSAPSVANSGSTGSGTSFSVLNPYGAGTWVIKT